jgi:hypothetical protein
MTIESWLDAALADVERRGLTALKPLLESLARTTRALREADFNADARGALSTPPAADPRIANTHDDDP